MPSLKQAPSDSHVGPQPTISQFLMSPTVSESSQSQVQSGDTPFSPKKQVDARISQFLVSPTVSESSQSQVQSGDTPLSPKKQVDARSDWLFARRRGKEHRKVQAQEAKNEQRNDTNGVATILRMLYSCCS